MNAAKAFLYSLAVPGMGQRAGGERVRGDIYLFSEVILLSGALFYTGENSLAEERYISFADQHFYYSGDDPDRKSYVEMWEILRERVYAKTSLPYTKTGEYYELIGKLPELQMFWDDPAQQDLYYDMRQTANMYFKRKNILWGALIANHIVSAVDAYISFKNRNISLSNTMDSRGRMAVYLTVRLH